MASFVESATRLARQRSQTKRFTISNNQGRRFDTTSVQLGVVLRTGGSNEELFRIGTEEDYDAEGR